MILEGTTGLHKVIMSPYQAWQHGCNHHVPVVVLARPDSLALMQIRCGDLYAGKVVEDFNACAITKHNCVAARVDVNKYPEPPASALVNSFDINKFTVSHLLCWV
jgi:hypothetical protein